MSYFLINILLALLWASLQQFRPVDVIGGFLLGYGIIAALRTWLGGSARQYVRRMPTFALFVLYYIWELIKSNLFVIRALLRDPASLKPGIIALRLTAKTDLEIVLLNNLITFTPGTLGVDLSDDRQFMFVHVLDVPDPEALKTSLKFGLERRLLEVLR